MPGRIVNILVLFFLSGSMIAPCQEKKILKPEPAVQKKSSYFQDSGSYVDNWVDRIRFKISYSWEKSGEYFRLACSSVTDTLPAKSRDAKSKLSIRKEEWMDKGKQAVRDATEKVVRDITDKGNELRQDLNKAGNELKTETVREIRENTDQLLK